MPLAFNSASHGQVAFGFFHIETDLLLLDRLFFWAADFCGLMARLAQGHGALSASLPGFTVSEPHNLGDLHGAIAGRDLHGFIGSLYGLSPFPPQRAAFRQNPTPALPAQVVANQMARFGQAIEIPVTADPSAGRLAIGEYRFDQAGAAALVDYVWRGGMPGWLDCRRPAYVLALALAIEQHPSPWFSGLSLDPARVGFAF